MVVQCDDWSRGSKIPTNMPPLGTGETGRFYSQHFENEACKFFLEFFEKADARERKFDSTSLNPIGGGRVGRDPVCNFAVTWVGQGPRCRDRRDRLIGRVADRARRGAGGPQPVRGAPALWARQPEQVPVFGDQPSRVARILTHRRTGDTRRWQPTCVRWVRGGWFGASV